MRRICLNIWLASLVAMLWGCEFRPLEEPGLRTEVNVAVNVETVMNVTCDIYNERIPVPEIFPDAMHVLFFDEKEDYLVSESFITGKIQGEDKECMMHGKVNIMPGTYKMLVYTLGTIDTDVLNYRSWSNIAARAKTEDEYVQQEYNTHRAEGGRASGVVSRMPEHIVVARNEKEVIPNHVGEHTIKAEATTVVETYYLQVKVEGLEYVSGAKAYLSGMASGNLLATNTKVESPEATIHIPLLKSTDEGVPVLCNVFNTFGRNQDAVNELSVTFDLTTVEGKVVSHTFDISDLFHSEACIKHHWLLLEETIKVDAESGGFKPGVGEWKEEDHNVFL